MSDVTDLLNTALEGRYRIDRELGEGGWLRIPPMSITDSTACRSPWGAEVHSGTGAWG